MITIRNAQLAAFSAASEERFRRSLVASLRRDHSSLVAGWSDRALNTEVDRAYARAPALGISRENSLSAYVALAVVVRYNFDEHERVRAFFTGAVSAEAAFASALSGLGPRDWAEIRSELIVRGFHYSANAVSP
jgi:hypothetical protein